MRKKSQSGLLITLVGILLILDLIAIVLILLMSASSNTTTNGNAIRLVNPSTSLINKTEFCLNRCGNYPAIGIDCGACLGDNRIISVGGSSHSDECSNNGDCDFPYEVCRSGECRACSSDSQCGNGYTCNSNGVCVYTNTTCSVNSDCGIPTSRLKCLTNVLLNVSSVVNETTNPTCGGGTCSFQTNEAPIAVCNSNQVCVENGNSASCVASNSSNVTCSNDLQCNDNNPFTQDVCNNAGTVLSYCSHNPLRCLNNLGCGTDAFVGSSFCQNGDVYQNQLKFTCNGAGLPTSSCSNATSSILKQDCVNGCSNGACLGEPIVCSTNLQCDDLDSRTEDVCANPGQTNSYCRHINIACMNDGECADTDSHTLDRCILPGLGISYCMHDRISCLNDGECNDNNPFTQDVCLFPATVNSVCQRTVIRCIINSDCGTDGFISGSETCQNGNVYQSYKTYSCGSAGTTQSSCSSSTELRLKQTCAYGCTGGICNPATINCTTSSQCGTDDWLGAKTCSSGNVFQNFRTYTCNNPGTAQSYCSHLVLPRLNQTCAYGCTNGACNPNNCTNQCTLGQQRCIQSNSFNRCGDYNNDGCYEWGTEQSCPTNQICDGLNTQTCIPTPAHTCVDSDPAGIDPDLQNVFMKGTATGYRFLGWFGSYSDYCNPSNGYLEEYYCTSPTGEVKWFDVDCSYYGAGYHCSDGACVTNVQCSTNSQCGTNGNIGSPVCSGSNVVQNYRTFTCNNAGTSSSYCSNATSQSILQTCNYGCTNGACNPTPTINCTTNSQCGTDGYIGSPTCSGTNVVQNYKTFTCNNPGTVNSVCSNAITTNKIKQTCNYGCTNGNCNSVPAPTCGSSDMGYNPLYTHGDDPFVRGTSQLSNGLGIVSDTCLSSGLLREYFCLNDFTISYFDANCSLFYDNATTKFSCVSGACVGRNVVCSTDSQCSDGDSSTVDKCLNPGTTSSYCTHEKIKCFKDSDCDDSNANTKDSCINLGTVNSYCTNVAIPKEAYLVVNVSAFYNKLPAQCGSGLTGNGVYVGNNRVTPAGNGNVIIPLTQNQKPIVDTYSTSYPSIADRFVQGVHVNRGVDALGNGYYEIFLYGQHTNDCMEGIKFDTTTLNSYISGYSNGILKSGSGTSLVHPFEQGSYCGFIPPSTILSSAGGPYPYDTYNFVSSSGKTIGINYCSVVGDESDGMRVSYALS